MKTEALRTFGFALIVATLLLALSPLGLTQDATNTTAITVPRLIKFSGVVRDEAGAPKTGVVGITFAFYKDQQGGAPLWLETQNLQADANGRYTAMLGTTKPDGLPIGFFSSNEARWVGVQMQGQNEQPRVLLVSAPYALKAADAETLGGKPISAFQLAAPQSANASTQTTQPPEQSNEISCAGGVACNTSFIPKFSTNGGSAKVNNSVISQSGTTVGIAGNLSLSGNLSASTGQVLGKTGSFTANTSGAVVSVGNQNASGIAVLGVNTNTNGGGAGVQGNGPNGVVGNGTTRGVTGVGGTIGVEGEATGTNSIGVTGTGSTGVVATGTSNGIGVSGQGGTGIFGFSSLTSGFARATVGVLNTTTAGSAAVYGIAQNTSGATNGVQGYNFSNTDFATGVSGVADGDQNKTFGVTGQSFSPTGTGVWGLGQGQSVTGGGVGCCAVGVWGDTSSDANSAAGLVGTADEGQALFLANNSSTALTANILNFESSVSNAVMLNVQAVNLNQFCNINTAGVLFCTGAHSLVVPVDNGQRQVALHAVESPQNWFEDFGSGRLESGVGRIALDSTFAETIDAASDYHVFLTPEGECRGLYISNKSATGFEVHEVGGGRSNVAFSYRIVALRRGYENARLEDETAMVAKMKDSARLPSPKPAQRWTTPVRPKPYTAPAIPANPAVVVPGKLASRQSPN